jgi:hypothetical protein
MTIGQIKFQGELATLDLIMSKELGEWLEQEATRQKITPRQLVKKILSQINKGVKANVK